MIKLMIHYVLSYRLKNLELKHFSIIFLFNDSYRLLKRLNMVIFSKVHNGIKMIVCKGNFFIHIKIYKL